MQIISLHLHFPLTSLASYRRASSRTTKNAFSPKVCIKALLPTIFSGLKELVGEGNLGALKTLHELASSCACVGQLKDAWYGLIKMTGTCLLSDPAKDEMLVGEMIALKDKLDLITSTAFSGSSRHVDNLYLMLNNRKCLLFRCDQGSIRVIYEFTPEQTCRVGNFQNALSIIYRHVRLQSMLTTS